jgi:hypothetical protein
MGGWFSDSSRSADTSSVIGTMFAVILALVILLALQSYQRAREGSSVESVAVTELHSVAGAFQPPLSDHLHGELVCYARAVIEDEWPALTLAYMVAQATGASGSLSRRYAIAFVSALASAGLIVVFFLDHPYTNESGNIAPTEMRRTLTFIDHGIAAPCDERGVASS